MGAAGLRSARLWGVEGPLPMSFAVPAAGPCSVLLQALSAPSKWMFHTGLVFLPSQTRQTWWSGGSPRSASFGPRVSAWHAHPASPPGLLPRAGLHLGPTKQGMGWGVSGRDLG